MSCFKSYKILYDCDATVLLNVYTYLVFVGRGLLPLVPYHLPQLRRMCLATCGYVNHEFLREVMAPVPEVEVFIG
jgi:hypothetical protein